MKGPDGSPESDRSFLTSRLLDAPRSRVFEAFRDPARLARWWGPKGFTNTFALFEFHAGGVWRFTMHAPNGGDFPNESVFREIEPEKIVIEHVSGPHYLLTITLAEESGKTRIGWRQVFDSVAIREQLSKLVAEANEQNLDRLEAELAA